MYLQAILYFVNASCSPKIIVRCILIIIVPQDRVRTETYRSAILQHRSHIEGKVSKHLSFSILDS